MARSCILHLATMKALGPRQKQLVADRIVTLIAEGHTDAQVIMATALAWTTETLTALKQAPDNPYGPEDEVLAQAVLDKLTEFRRR